MVKTPLLMQSENEGYTAMANALRRDPRKLRSMLLARRKDLRSLLETSKGRKDKENMGKLSAALNEVDDALARLILPAPTDKPAKLSAADSLEGEEEDEDEADDTDSDDLEEENDEEEDADDETSDDDEEVDEEPVEDDLEGEDPEEEVDEVEDEAEAAPAESSEPTEPENPVAMNSRLRKEMGDSSADFLDDYGLAIHKKVMSFFESLMTKALDLGQEDDTDGESSLREVLRDEVGKRGIRRIEPVFPEWRGAVIKQIAKDVAAMFQPPEAEPEAEVVPDAAPDEPDAQDEAGDAGEAGAPAVASTDNTPIVNLAAGRVSFAVKAGAAVSAQARPQATQATDFKPSGFTTPRLD